MFDGNTYVPERDEERLTTQFELVFDLMRDGRWRTLPEIRAVIGRGSVASISARLRDFRKVGYSVDRRYIADGLWEYRLGDIL